MTARTVLTPVQLRNRHFVTEDGGVDVYRAYPPVIVLESLKQFNRSVLLLIHLLVIVF